MHSEKSNYIIGADTNLNFLKYQIDTHITDYVNSILSLGCISLINKPNRFSSSHQPSLLDHIFTSNSYDIPAKFLKISASSLSS